MPWVRAAAGPLAALLSTFAPQHVATMVYADVMGCEGGCTVAGAGWPLAFVVDYPALSVAGHASLFDAAVGADRFDPVAFVVDAVAWGLLASLLAVVCRRVAVIVARRRASSEG